MPISSYLWSQWVKTTVSSALSAPRSTGGKRRVNTRTRRGPCCAQAQPAPPCLLRLIDRALHARQVHQHVHSPALTHSAPRYLLVHVRGGDGLRRTGTQWQGCEWQGPLTGLHWSWSGGSAGLAHVHGRKRSPLFTWSNLRLWGLSSHCGRRELKSSPQFPGLCGDPEFPCNPRKWHAGNLLEFNFPLPSLGQGLRASLFFFFKCPFLTSECLGINSVLLPCEDTTRSLRFSSWKAVLPELPNAEILRN